LSTSCLNEDATSPQANRSAASKTRTGEDHRTFTRRQLDHPVYPVPQYPTSLSSTQPIGILTRETAIENNSISSSHVVDLLANGVMGSVDIDHVSIVHDAPRLPSETLLNTNRRAMGMEDCHAPMVLKKETKAKKNR
jgi:hypothetical protein